MASRVGPRVTTSDGSDFRHRQTIASHYQASSTNKSRLKAISILHFLLVALMLCRLSVSLFVMFGMRPPTFFQKLRLPKAQAWEYWWLASVLPSIFGLLSLRKNRRVLIMQYLIGMLIFGLGPVVFAMYDLSDDLLSYWKTRESKLLFFGFPLVVIYNMFLAIALQVHIFGCYFAYQLLNAWKPKVEKKKLT